ncbi:hypothetical protein BmR1_04g09570 [Babesia microti strain RI]|uniref:Uncharacterized protein n=1 Tax=Babesia microti (strain RI) TaxID=1133968 RepID=I7J9W1_BABMR|nr:hypothetical protein BmR1_04g09570 [Babesia microti strain RI]CCF76083.1 hypothetical protein BmR1_04g09570 [Babesia microti strain RI]|eukprot:XP_012650491.1 hypothetical protein BmR1_04g09570 [Babesia microti strain RI]
MYRISRILRTIPEYKRTKYNPNVVNEAVNPKPGWRLPSVGIYAALAGFMLTIPVVSTYLHDPNERAPKYDQ